MVSGNSFTWMEFVGLYVHLAGFVIGLGAVTVIDLHGFLGRVSATSDVLAPAPVANTMYCRPWCMNVIGIAVVREGMATLPTCFPVALSTANSPGGSSWPFRPVP